MTTQQLAGKVAVVTGSARGIGRAIADAYAAEGASVVYSDVNLEGVREAVKEAEGRGGTALALQTDVTDYQAVERMFAATEERFGGLDILVANAGVDGDYGTIENGDPVGWAATVSVNLVGAFHCAKACVPPLKRRGGGKVIFIGSGNARRGYPRMSAYSCSKAGLAMLRRVMSQEVWEDNITVNEYVPGPVDTQMSRDSIAGRAITVPGFDIEWLKTPEDATPMAVFLATLPPNGPTGQSFTMMRRDV